MQLKWSYLFEAACPECGTANAYTTITGAINCLRAACKHYKGAKPAGVNRSYISAYNDWVANGGGNEPGESRKLYKIASKELENWGKANAHKDATKVEKALKRPVEKILAKGGWDLEIRHEAMPPRPYGNILWYYSVQFYTKGRPGAPGGDFIGEVTLQYYLDGTDMWDVGYGAAGLGALFRVKMKTTLGHMLRSSDRYSFLGKHKRMGLDTSNL
jgi:hypothetical protein